MYTSDYAALLPEAGRPIENIVREIRSKRQEIINLKAKIRSLEDDIEGEELHLMKLVKKEWTEPEILKAKSEARLLNTI